MQYRDHSAGSAPGTESAGSDPAAGLALSGCAETRDRTRLPSRETLSDLVDPAVMSLRDIPRGSTRLASRTLSRFLAAGGEPTGSLRTDDAGSLVTTLCGAAQIGLCQRFERASWSARLGILRVIPPMRRVPL